MGGRVCGQAVLGRYLSKRRTGCANERPSGSVRGASGNRCPYRDLKFRVLSNQFTSVCSDDECNQDVSTVEISHRVHESRFQATIAAQRGILPVHETREWATHSLAITLWLAPWVLIALAWWKSVRSGLVGPALLAGKCPRYRFLLLASSAGTAHYDPVGATAHRCLVL